MIGFDVFLKAKSIEEKKQNQSAFKREIDGGPFTTATTARKRRLYKKPASKTVGYIEIEHVFLALEIHKKNDVPLSTTNCFATVRWLTYGDHSTASCKIQRREPIKWSKCNMIIKPNFNDAKQEIVSSSNRIIDQKIIRKKINRPST
ncbi:hypothetical protein WA026_007825 [Henosepilachna vigintioctopunctata]|uniref:Uncharacterized protein n=1 Tax=Henosepilachna vigintioctopunctata TaxID=420089 RepID=A0AAW1U6B2_9CUCU